MLNDRAMTELSLLLRRALKLAVLALVLVLAGCRKEAGPTDLFVAAADELQGAHCTCGSEDGCEERPLESECEERIVRRHEGSIGGWLECVARAMHSEAECVEKSDCSEQALEGCRREPEDVCGSAPAFATQQIQQDIGRSCPERLQCSDGSFTSGRLCNDIAECEDGSDEFCDGDSTSSDTGGSGGVSGADGFFCHDGTFLPLGAQCDGFAECSDGSDEPPFVGCPMPTTPPRVLPPPTMVPPPPSMMAIDAGVAPGGDAGVIGPANPMCLQAVSGISSVSSSCLHCACAAAPIEVSSCDETCWALIGCIGVRCPSFAPGSSEQTNCAVELCGDFLGGAMVATLVGPVIREQCSAACPVPPGTPQLQ